MLNTLNATFRTAVLAGLFLISAIVATYGDEREAGIQTVINRQLEAFRQSDADAAWAIAAPSIQKQFGTRDRFMAMVGSYYPQIMNSKSAVFKGLRDINGIIVQRVFVEGGPGDFIDAYYSMELIDGMWRITGVYITKPKPAGA